MLHQDDYTSIADELPEPFRLLVKPETSSTNDDVRALGTDGATDGMVVIARRQTAGRGRRGAAWFAPDGESLTFSVLVRPPEPPAIWPRLALATGLAVARALENHLPLVGIKWPNDVWIGQRKVAGILVEAGPGFAVIGIGININSLTFPPEIATTATSLRIESGSPHPLPRVLAEVLHHLHHYRQQIGTDFGNILHGVRQRCVLTGQVVSLTTPNGPLAGTVEGIAPGGELLLRNPAGVHRLLQADDVRLM